MESSREMDEMRRWNGNQSHSGLQMMEEVTTHRPTGKKDSDIRVTWKHDKKLVHMKENWPHSIQCLQAFHINIPVSTNCVQVSTQKTKTKTKMQEWDLYSPRAHVTCFSVLKFKTQTLISVPSLSVLCLLLIAIRLTRAHTRDCLITHSFSTCPSIIQLMQSFMWPFQSIPSREMLSQTLGSYYWGLTLVLWHCYSGHFTIWSLPAVYYQSVGIIGLFIRLYVATALSTGHKH